ncbi:DUF2254 domain-containing protein [Pantoea sp. Pa-EAmG]|uniref:DUF2254 domain-containing protein n=1 Tax=Pantoea sp. Pa-EAmG TaxID=3043311 RepID=UPI0024AFE975|nr:DUF2254 domain-containing protein [Pantoea sp. Pa-EAmG]MDI6958498.1 DUF2254 domain-containing protein [Pantoea sp. Pa-EAmG]
MTKTQWILGQITRKLWFRSALFAVLAVLTALLAIALKPVLPASASGLTGADSVDKILTILASSMLAVTTFSLNIVVSAYNTASSSVTPRATRLLLEDRTTQNVLATFIGSFLYSLVGIIALSMGAFGAHGRVILFFVTLAVIVMIVLTLLRWIQHLALFGRMDDTCQRVELATVRALKERLSTPLMGCAPWPADEQSFDAGYVLTSSGVGYLQHIDMQRLATLAEEKSIDIFLEVQPGAFLHGTTTLLRTGIAPDEETASEFRASFTVGEQRSFEQDPRFGLCVLSEIASRALSPAVNAPGTAIDIIGRAVRILSADNKTETDKPLYPRLHMRPLMMRDLFDDVFTAIARDGAGMLEVQIRLHKALAALSRLRPEIYAEEAYRHSAGALRRAKKVMSSEDDIAMLTTLFVRLNVPDTHPSRDNM